jgi:hypothetical protein
MDNRSHRALDRFIGTLQLSNGKSRRLSKGRAISRRCRPHRQGSRIPDWLTQSLADHQPLIDHEKPPTAGWLAILRDPARQETSAHRHRSSYAAYSH